MYNEQQHSEYTAMYSDEQQIAAEECVEYHGISQCEESCHTHEQMGDKTADRLPQEFGLDQLHNLRGEEIVREVSVSQQKMNVVPLLKKRKQRQLKQCSGMELEKTSKGDSSSCETASSYLIPPFEIQYMSSHFDQLSITDSPQKEHPKSAMDIEE